MCFCRVSCAGTLGNRSKRIAAPWQDVNGQSALVIKTSSATVPVINVVVVVLSQPAIASIPPPISLTASQSRTGYPHSNLTPIVPRSDWSGPA